MPLVMFSVTRNLLPWMLSYLCFPCETCGFHVMRQRSGCKTSTHCSYIYVATLDTGQYCLIASLWQYWIWDDIVILRPCNNVRSEILSCIHFVIALPWGNIGNVRMLSYCFHNSIGYCFHIRRWRLESGLETYCFQGTFTIQGHQRFSRFTAVPISLSIFQHVAKAILWYTIFGIPCSFKSSIWSL